MIYVAGKVIADITHQELARSWRLVKQLREEKPAGDIHSDTQHITLAEHAGKRKNKKLKNRSCSLNSEGYTKHRTELQPRDEEGDKER